jgi:hypothetical protein
VFNRKKNTILCEEEIPELQNIKEVVRKYYKPQKRATSAATARKIKISINN